MEMKEKGFLRLKRNIMDVIKESQIKLGYEYGSMQLYYPLTTLNRMMKTELSEGQMEELLQQFVQYVKDDLGTVEYSARSARFAFNISAEGVKYVHETLEASPFLTELVMRSAGGHISIDEMISIFRKYSECVVVEEINNGEFDCVVYFKDGKPDDYRYCLHDEGGHVIYHRFSKEDYQDF